MIKKPVLAMSILIRDEIDILEDNIRFHYKYGVDSFVIGDNGSTDGSRELVEKLAETIPIYLVDFPPTEFKQSHWMTKMAHIARKQFGAQWVINNDADEFWLPQSDNLKNHLMMKDKVVQVIRANMLVASPDKPYYASHWRVASPINYALDYQESLAKMSLLLVAIKPNVIVNPYGLIKVKGGNHSANHWFWWTKPRLEQGILVYHFPIRSYEQFSHEVKRMAGLLANMPTTKKIGQHRRRWAKLFHADKLREEYDNFFFTNTELKLLENIGVIVRDERISLALAQLRS